MPSSTRVEATTVVRYTSSHNCKRQDKTRGFRRVRALERTSGPRRLMRTRLSVYAAKRLRVMRCLLSECNCSLFVGLTRRTKQNVRRARSGDVEDHAYYYPILQSRRLKIWRRQRYTGPVKSAWTHTEHILHHEANQRPPPEPRESQIDVLSCHLLRFIFI